VRGTGSLVRVLARDNETSGHLSRALWWESFRRGILMVPTGPMAASTPMGEALIYTVATAGRRAAERAVLGPTGHSPVITADPVETSQIPKSRGTASES
jgi:hypothetical protein